jgi:hypothetical protein
MKHLDCKSAGSGEVEGSGPVHVLGFTELDSRRLQPIVDIIDHVVRILHEANVKPLGIGDLVRMIEITDGEHETSVIRQYDVGAGPTGLSAALFLHDRGLPVRIIDQNVGPSTTSRAQVVNPRALELFTCSGVATKKTFLASSLTLHGIRFGGSTRLPDGLHNRESNDD